MAKRSVMDKKLVGQTVLVTGAARGLGASFCAAVAAAGAQVLALGRNQAALTAMIKNLPGRGHDVIVADVTDPAGLAHALSGHMFHAVINNAGIAATAALHNSAVDDAKNVIDTNLLGNLWVLQASVPVLKAAGGGVVVNIASVLGHRPLAHTGIYAASKAAVIQMTRSAALELARDNIRVNALAPGYITTDLNRAFLDSDDGARLAKRVPLRRFAVASELTAALIFLLDPQNSYMTGETLTIDGGMSAGL
jgi:NAD(P)-dependent dehydrogenase (short-subunit alcohol dehydrogenase family)